jgi:hypothetical protein
VAVTVAGFRSTADPTRLEQAVDHGPAHLPAASGLHTTGGTPE